MQISYLKKNKNKNREREREREKHNAVNPEYSHIYVGLNV